MNKKWRWQRITFALVSLIVNALLCYNAKIGPEVYAGLFTVVAGLFGYQKYQESKPTNGGS